MGPAASADARAAPPGLDEARAWSGHRLDDIDGRRVGSVVGVLVGDPSRRLEWLLARMGRFGHHTAVPSRDAVEGFGRVWVPYTRELIRAAPWVEPGDPLAAGVERELLAHYGIVASPARRAYLDGRAGEAITAHPA